MCFERGGGRAAVWTRKRTETHERPAGCFSFRKNPKTPKEKFVETRVTRLHSWCGFFVENANPAGAATAETRGRDVGGGDDDDGHLYGATTFRSEKKHSNSRAHTLAHTHGHTNTCARKYYIIIIIYYYY